MTLGLTHILSGLMFANNFFMPTSMVLNRVLDIPFAMMALVYGLLSVYVNIDEKARNMPKIAFIAICAIIFLLLLYVNLFIPDKQAFTLS